MRKSWVRCPGCNRKQHAKTVKAGTMFTPCAKQGKTIQAGRFK